MNELETIQKSQLLDDVTFIHEHSEQLQQTLLKQQMFRTKTEMNISVLNGIDHPTPASKYWQCVREQAGMYGSLIQMSFDYRRKAYEVEKLRMPGASTLARIEIEEGEYAMFNMRMQAQDRLREIEMWQNKMDELDDGSFDTENVDTHQLESYNKRFRLQAEIMGANGSPVENSNLLGQLRTSEQLLNNKAIS